MVWKFIHLARISIEGPLDDAMLQSGNCSYCLLALRTDQFVDRTFRGSNWNWTEQFVNNCYPLINHVLIMQANFTWKAVKFFAMSNLNIYYFKRIFFERVLWYYTWYTRNFSDCQMALRAGSFCWLDISRV